MPCCICAQKAHGTSVCALLSAALQDTLQDCLVIPRMQEHGYDRLSMCVCVLVRLCICALCVCACTYFFLSLSLSLSLSFYACIFDFASANWKRHLSVVPDSNFMQQTLCSVGNFSVL